MNLHKCLLTENNCYKAGVKITPAGIMVHSTGANNPTLRRYVQPDDGLLGVNQYNNDWNCPKPDGVEICAHAFIGKLKDGTVATYQTLPWDIRGWHSGYANKYSTTNANKLGYIGFEICEDALSDPDYLAKVYQEAVELTAYLCDLYELDPLADGVVICHSEGYARGIAYNHGDVTHWWPKHGRTMDNFRDDVAAQLAKLRAATTEPVEETAPEMYKTLEDIPDYWREEITWLMERRYLLGDEHGDLNLSYDAARNFVVLSRALQDMGKQS